MKKFVVAIMIIGAFIFYSFMYSHAAAILPNSSASSGSSSGAASQTSTTAPAATSTTGSAGTSGTSGTQYKDGTYTGSVANALWGYVQVQASIKNGKITNVTFLQYPSDHNLSVQINNYADPQLSSEAIQAQNANVNVVTGATDSSEAFMQSLTNALSQAAA